MPGVTVPVYALYETWIVPTGGDWETQWSWGCGLWPTPCSSVTVDYDDGVTNGGFYYDNLSIYGIASQEDYYVNWFKELVFSNDEAAAHTTALGIPRVFLGNYDLELLLKQNPNLFDYPDLPNSNPNPCLSDHADWYNAADDFTISTERTSLTYSFPATSQFQAQSNSNDGSESSKDNTGALGFGLAFCGAVGLVAVGGSFITGGTSLLLLTVGSGACLGVGTWAGSYLAPKLQQAADDALGLKISSTSNDKAPDGSGLAALSASFDGLVAESETHFGLTTAQAMGINEVRYQITNEGGNVGITIELSSLEFFGGAGNDTLIGGTRDDVISGGDNADILLGLMGNDKLRGDDGNDALLGGSGNDTLEGGIGSDYLNGGDGIDFASYENASNAVTVDLQAATVNTGDALGDKFFFIEGLTGSAFDDILRGDVTANVLMGQFGNDTLIGRNGLDELHGGAGSDFLNGGNDNDSLFGGAGSDDIVGGTGNDLANGGNGNDYILGGAGNDTLIGGNGNDTLNGGSNNDVIAGGDGVDRLLGGIGSDLINGGDGRDFIAGQNGNDRIVGGLGNDNLSGGNGSDLFIMDDNWGRDRITDFNLTLDRLNLSGVSDLNTQDDLLFSDFNGSLLIRYGANSILLEGLKTENIEDLNLLL